METINKLLKKQAPKTNARRKDMDGSGPVDAADIEYVKPNPAFVRWISSKDGNIVAVPEEFVEAPVGAIFRGNGQGKLVEEVL